MKSPLQKYADSLVSYFDYKPQPPPSEWCVENVRFDEPGNRGPFSVIGREYIIEPLNEFNDFRIQDSVEVYGSQTGKTSMLMAGVQYRIFWSQAGILWVMPSVDLARSFSETRWLPSVRASVLRDKIPTGAERHDFKKLQQMLGRSVLNLIGSNAPGNLASRPADLLVMDEVDKFNQGTRGEADAVDLAEQRTKGRANVQRRKTSTPTLIGGLIWQEFMKGDQRRYFVPCPSCQKHVVFAWSKAFSVLPKTGVEAYIVWDKEAKRSGGWDLDRVLRSARAECPHCGFHIRDSHKTKMIRDGEWRPTAKSEAGFRSRQLSSLYAATPETTFGKLAVKFLQKSRSLSGLQGFINGDLAEPYESQDRQAERTEIITAEITASEGVNQLTVDCQATSPYFYYIARRFTTARKAEGIEAGHCETYEDLRAVQQRLGVKDAGVLIDSGFGAKSDAEVYRSCVRFCELVTRPNRKPLALGWMPAKGMPTRRRWKDPKTELELPYYLRPIDPFLGTAGAGRVEMSLFEFAGDYFKDLLEILRKGGRGGLEWSVPQQMATDEYWRHMDAEIKTAVYSKHSGKVQHTWQKRSSGWPNHWLDCEVMQLALAAFYKLYHIE